jgi:vitamin B12 transporter
MTAIRSLTHTLASSFAPLCVSLGLSLGLLPNSPAQTPSTQEPIVVTASRNEQRVSDALPATQVISREQIAQSGASDLPALLRMLSSADMAQTGGAGQVSSVFLRGAESRHTLVLMDGVPLNQADLGRASLEHLSLANIDRVEIVRGNLSSLYGSQAVGGVIQLFTRQGRTMAASIGVGSARTIVSSVQYGDIFGSTKLNVALAHQQTDGISAQNPNTNPGADGDKDGYRNTSANLALTHTLALGHDLSFKATSTRARSDYDDSYATGKPQTRHSLNSLALGSKNAISDQWTSKLDVSATSEKLEDATGYTTQAINKTRLAQWDNSYGFAPGQALQFGLEYKRNLVEDTPSSNYATRNTQSARAAYLLEAGAWQAQLNVRRDKITGLEAASTYYAGGSYKLSTDWRLLASASSSYSAPSFSDQFYADPAAPLLKPERGLSRELGVQYTQTGMRIRLTGFDAKIKDKIAFDPSTFYTSNIARSKNRGADLSVSLDVPNGKFGVEASANNPINEDSGKALLRRSRESLALSYTVNDGAWDAGTYVKYTGARQDIDPQTFTTITNPARTRVDFTLAYRLSKQLSLLGKLENAFNERKDEVLGYSATPRGVFFTLRYSE